MEDISFLSDNNRFNFRVAGFVTYKDSILLVKHDKCDFYNIPGGRVKMNESTFDAIKRELQEELGIEVKDPKLFYVFENFFYWIDKNVQELLFVYHVELENNSPLLKERIFINKDNNEEKLYWKNFDELKNIKCLPEIIYDFPKMNLNEITHLVKI